ncbi:MAG: MBL fold metallo-hydrolase [Sphingobacteriales bacterium]|nr:MAG: MBL fold metallo-hydrolase [Sphingobacteriales bacterium]
MYYNVLKEFFFEKKTELKPVSNIPALKTNLKKLDAKKDVLIWFGHSSYFMQVDGKTILVDPVLSNSASPISFTTKAFNGTNVYSENDIPEIDYLFITHDHWDHLNYETLKKLKPKIKKIICGLGTGQHLERWGFDLNKIIEKDWGQTILLDKGFIVNTVPARHFSGRGFKRNKALWLSFVLQTPSLKIFIGGDSGYDVHFEDIGNKFGPFDWAILENGQYDKSWKYIHMMPDVVLLATQKLKAKQLIPVHSAKFALANHTWFAPLHTITALNINKKIRIATPKIGEEVDLKKSDQNFTEWWVGIK